MRVLSLGGGVQSSTLLLMAVHGELQLDRAIFADTQWEPAATYEWLETLLPIAERAGIPVDVVTAGNIR
jgi:3'-phosphoadenosine 5'-phosphosulfate sulfotransferase (PAPS reductase)/FAD synthetase